ncbi:hypothetical protein HOY82DRAFT_538225 [Tuber indicum]|nr:hypothetical protein HOY82DRAFT_538225 [Tuber indicum]
MLLMERTKLTDVTDSPTNTGGTKPFTQSCAPTKYTRDTHATNMDQRQTIPTDLHSPLDERQQSDTTKLFTPPATPSSPNPPTLWIKGANEDTLVDFFKEQNITLHADDAWIAFTTFMWNFIEKEAKAKVLRTLTERFHNRDLVIGFEISTASACHDAVQILTKYKAFGGCEIECRNV